MIVFESVVRRFGRVEALAGVTLAFGRGRVVGVVGPNGAGKSTLFGLVLGFVAPTSGRVTIEGRDPRTWVRTRGAGYLPERFEVAGEWRVGGLLRALAQLEGEGGGVERALRRWGLEEVADRRVGGLSRGMLQRVGLAQAVLGARSLVVLDEPSEGLDPLWRIRLRDEIAALRAAGVTVLLASHDLAEVERVADVVVLLDRGRVVEVVERGAGGGVSEWRLRLGTEFNVGRVFPGAVGAGGEWVVRAEGASDLSARLAALLAAGAVVSAVEPVAEGLEARVRRVLESSDG